MSKVTYKENMDKALSDSKLVSKKIQGIVEIISKYDLLLGVTHPSAEQMEEKNLTHMALIHEFSEMPLQIMTPQVIKRDDDRLDLLILTSASLFMMVGSVLAKEYETTLPGLFEILKGTTSDVDRIVVDYTESVASYIRKVALYQLKNPITIQNESGEMILQPERLDACHAAGGIQSGEVNMNALSVGINISLNYVYVQKKNPHTIIVIDDITGVEASMDYSKIDMLIPDDQPKS